jgi:hypothetical protein
MRRWSLTAAGLLLRFDPSPKRIALAAATSIFALVGLAYWLNILPPLGGYKELGFLVPGDDSAPVVNTTPLAAISSGPYGVGGPVAVPNLVRLSPVDNSRDVPTGAPVTIRFDQPMDRASVERSWAIDPPAAGSLTWDADNEVRFSPYEPGLLRGITYTVILSNTARSLTGTPLRQPISLAFRTKDPYGVVPGTSPGMGLSPTDTLTLSFDTPMNREQTLLSLHAATSGEDLPLTLDWDADGRKVRLSPDLPMPEGTVYLRAGATSRTQAGDLLGLPHEFAYTVTQPASRLRLLDGRIKLVSAGVASTLRYDIGEDVEPSLTEVPVTGYIPDEGALSGLVVTLSLYNLPAEYISALGAQKRPWPMTLPAQLPASLPLVQTFWTALREGDMQEGEANLPDTLSAGTYLLVASRLGDTGVLTDWQMLVVADGHLTTTTAAGAISFWATNKKGHSWAGSEVSLYSAEGALLEKGLTDERGLWTPDMPKERAALAIARDGAGHLATMLLDLPKDQPEQESGSLAATLRTDRAEYYPGQAVSFRVLLHSIPGGDTLPTTSNLLSDRGIEISLLTPGANVLSSLTLKPDDVGGASGLFNLPGDLRPGEYALRVISGRDERLFPLYVKSRKNDTLSVYIVPAPPEDVITRTVSVLGPGGVLASGANLTVTLGITGDVWASEPVTATTNADGKAVVVLPLPAWVASYNDPGLYIKATANLKDLSGSDSHYLDLTSMGVARAAMRQLVSPALNIAAVARPSNEGAITLRIVRLNGAGAEGDILLSALAPTGEREIWSLDLSSAGDLTLSLPRKYAGGQVEFFRAGVPGSRRLALMPASSRGAELQLTAPATAEPDENLALNLGVMDKEGQGLTGTASVWFRRVADGDLYQVESPKSKVQGLVTTLDFGLSTLNSVGWHPDVPLSATGRVSSTVQAPGTPGLWYIFAEAATADGGYVRSFSVLRVMPGLSIQTPPTSQVQAMQPGTLSVLVHNPLTQTVSASMVVAGGDALRATSSDLQSLTIAPGSSRRVDWRLQASRSGTHTATLSLKLGGEAAGAWSLNVVASESTRTNMTYASGVFFGEHAVGVLVPSGLPPAGVELEVRASTSLLTTLSSIPANLLTDSPSSSKKAGAAAARLSSSAAVAWAYTQADAQGPPEVSLTAGESAQLLEQIYAAQHADGSWSAEDAGLDASQGSITGTAHIMLALRRYTLASPNERRDPQLPVDSGVIERGLAYLTSEITRPVGDHPSAALLDERAYGLYILSSYGLLQAEVVRPYIIYTSTGNAGLSRAGRAWLASALLQSGSTQDGLVLANKLLSEQVKTASVSDIPVLEALLTAEKAASQVETPYRTRPTSPYATALQAYARLVLESRHGLGWSTYGETSNAMWALSRYAAQAGEKPTTGLPALTLNDRTVQVPPGSQDSAVSLIISGSELHAGTNWLKLRASPAGQSLYYSLTLRATR